VVVKVKGDASLVCIQVKIQAAIFGVRDPTGEWAKAAREIAIRWLNLDYVRTIIGEEPRAKWRGDEVA